jgi:hypothetical protein
MLLLILVVVISLVAWALHLMEQAVQSQEFSFMLAGFLVASSAAAMMAVYFLMNHYMVYMDQTVSIVYPDSYFFSDGSSISTAPRLSDELSSAIAN